MADEIQIGIIGGSGLYKMEALTDKDERSVDTPFGKPSDNIVVGTLAGHRVAFVPRHGRGHMLMPSEVPYRANVYALKSLGARYIIAVSACGSLREDYAPGEIVLADQLVDFTKGTRPSTFFGGGVVAHVGVAEPFCHGLRTVLAEAIGAAGGTVHTTGTYVTVEGPRFSTRGESALYRQWGLDIIGMTTSPEAFLAREAEICYAVMAMVTDYDSWRDTEVTVAEVIETFQANINLAQTALIEAIPRVMALSDPQPAHSALSGALTSDRDRIPDARREELALLMNSLLG
ncbi:MAG: S-methyl-5'-thioadenosine phosphorylase [Chloroflexi bacterium]|nr:S-methyl-5'-thioadenosine phosphorylase [Chloroflexota bacterium]